MSDDIQSGMINILAFYVSITKFSSTAHTTWTRVKSSLSLDIYRVLRPASSLDVDK